MVLKRVLTHGRIFFSFLPGDVLFPVLFACIAWKVSVAGLAGKGGGQDSSAVKTFRLEACQVSTVAKAFVSLVRATLTEACSDEVTILPFFFYRRGTRRELHGPSAPLLFVLKYQLTVYHYYYRGA